MEQKLIVLTGTVEKLIDRSVIKQPEQAHICFAEAEPLYRELRIPNVHGWQVGTPVEITLRPRVCEQSKPFWGSRIHLVRQKPAASLRE
jgi:hypothetical protein